MALPFWQHRALPAVVQMCTQLGIDFQVVPDFYELSFDEDLVTGRASYRGGTIGLGNESAAIAVEGSLMRLMRLPAGKQL